MSSEHEMDETPHEEAAEDSAAHEGDEAQPADADFTDEDWNAEADESGDDHAGEGGEGAAPKKKMKMNVMIIGAAVVVGLGVFYMMMSKKSVPLPPPSAMQAAVPKSPPTDTDMIYGASTEPDQPKADKNKTPQKGIMDDPTLVKKLQKMSDSHVVTQSELAPENPTPSLAPKEVKSAPPMPAPISQSDHKPAVGPAAGPLTPLPQEENGTPFAKMAATTPPAPAPMVAAKVTPPPSSDKAASPEWPAPSGEKPVKAATPETMAAKIPDMGKPASMSATPVTMPGNAAASASLDRITNKLDMIESELKALQDSSVRKDELADVRAQLSSLQEKIGGSSAQTGHPSAKQAGAKAVHRQHSVRTAATSSSARHKGMPVASSWTLKSAQPGMAIVAQADGQMVTVRPGDKLHGLGRVKSISEENGRWVVKGTAGVLTQ